MKYVDEFRARGPVRALAERIRRTTSRPWTIMEVCGGQTHAIVRFGLDQLLPDEVTLVHGPGCPVCVTPLELIDKAITIAALPEVTLCTFGDMMRVPGSGADLLSVRAAGHDVRVVYSPVDAVSIAEASPKRQVVFFGVGFETTAPANAMAVYAASERQLSNFSVLMSHVLVPPAIGAIMDSPEARVNGFLAAGHVCTVMGTAEYDPIATKYGVPIVVTGFEPTDILQGILVCITHLEAGAVCVDNQYSRSVRPEGNPAAREMLNRMFVVCDRKWRGIGTIPRSGWRLSQANAAYDAELRFDVGSIAPEEPAECISGLILQGVRKPSDCTAFGLRCTPEHPLGATMVSSEGACSAYHRYRGHGPQARQTHDK